MKQFIITYLPLLLSVITAYTVLAAGNHKKHAWSVGLLSQIFWLLWIILDEKWTFIPMNLVMWYAYGRNYLKWMREELKGKSRVVV